MEKEVLNGISGRWCPVEVDARQREVAEQALEKMKKLEERVQAERIAVEERMPCGVRVRYLKQEEGGRVGGDRSPAGKSGRRGRRGAPKAEGIPAGKKGHGGNAAAKRAVARCFKRATL